MTRENESHLVTDAMATLDMPSGRYKPGDLAVLADEIPVRMANGTLHSFHETAGDLLDEEIDDFCLPVL